MRKNKTSGTEFHYLVLSGSEATATTKSTNQSNTTDLYLIIPISTLTVSREAESMHAKNASPNGLINEMSPLISFPKLLPYSNIIVEIFPLLKN